MRRKLRKSWEIYSDEGVISLGKAVRRHLVNRHMRKIEDPYWNLVGGTQEITIAETSATFDAKTELGGDNIRGMARGERKFLEDMLSELESEDTFYDIGANIGIFSCFAAQKLSEGYTVSFEPYPPNVVQLERNLGYNADASKYRILDVALSDSSGEIEFTAPSEDPGHQTATINPDADSINVRTVPGDELVDEESLPTPTVVKIDVEGAEPLVLRGLQETLSKEKCRVLYCEIHLPAEHRPSIEDYGETEETTKKMITDAGFDIEFVVERGSDLHIKGVKKSRNSNNNTH